MHIIHLLVQSFISLLFVLFMIGLNYFTGFAPSLFFVQRSKIFSNHFWVLTPFVGMGLNTLVLLNLVYLNIPLKTSTPFFFLGVLLLNALVLYKNKQVRIPKPTWVPLLAAFFCLFVHGLGYFWMGHKNYVAYGWIDQFNYTAITQFLIDHPIKSSDTIVDQQPYLLAATSKKWNRIGQSIIQGIPATLVHTDAKNTYGPTQILSPFLTFLALWLIVGKYFKKTSTRLYITTFACMVPGFAQIHLLCFLSNALFIPLIFLYLYVFDSALDKKEWPNICLAALLTGLIYAIYSETILFLLGVSIAMTTFSVLKERHNAIKNSAILLISIAGILLANPFIVQSYQKVGMVPNLLEHIFPYAFEMNGINRLWLGTQLSSYTDNFVVPFNWVTLMLSVFSVAGLFALWNDFWDELSVGIFALCSVPLLILCMPQDYPYPYYKLMMSFSPLFAIGLLHFLRTDELRKFNWKSTKLLHILGGIFLAYLIFSVGLISSFAKSGRGRSVSTLTHNPKMIGIYKELEQLQDTPLLLRSNHPYTLAWMLYYARKNPVWILSSQFADIDLNLYQENFTFRDIGQMPQDVRIIDADEVYPTIEPENLSSQVLISIENPQGLEKWGNDYTCWLGTKKETLYLKIFSRLEKPHPAAFSFTADPGIGNPETPLRTILVADGKTAQKILIDQEKFDCSFTSVLQPGWNTISMAVIQPEQPTYHYQSDKRALMASITKMKLTLK